VRRWKQDQSSGEGEGVMKLKQVILQVMDRDLLKRVTDELGIDGVDRRDRADMSANVSRKHRATPAFLLEFLSEAQVKEVCELVGISAVGRRAALIEMLVAGEQAESGDHLPHANGSTAGKIETKAAKINQTGNRRNAEKSVTRYTYDDIKEPRTPETGHTSLLPAEEQVVSVPMDNGWSKAIQVGHLPEGDGRPVIVDMDPAADPLLLWAGKRNRREVPILPLQRNEIVSESRIAQIIERARRAADEKSGATRQGHLFADLEKTLRESDRAKRVEFYTHDEGWKNKLICGDSLQVMESLLRYENLGGKVQMIYIDPPYGISYDTNFQQRVDSTKNDQKDSADDVLTIKAFRDTWSLGVHSYLSYLHERLYLCRELLAGSGSIFMQIGNENAHLVKNLMDEVFGYGNRIADIYFAKAAGRGSGFLDSLFDTLLWYSKDRDRLPDAYQQLYIPKLEIDDDPLYKYVERLDGTVITLSAAQIRGDVPVPEGRRFRLDPLVSEGESEGGSEPFSLPDSDGAFVPPPGTHWKLKRVGLEALARKKRIFPLGKQLRYKRYPEDSKWRRIANIWLDTQKGTFEGKRRYVVQTAQKVIERCIFMTTRPGDLVLDITCGSGTSALAAENLGRRWIVCDTSRVAVNVARTQLLEAQFDCLQRRGSKVSDGFVYEVATRLGNAQKLGLHNLISGRDGVVPVGMEFVALEI
jgi:DNA modification methylase